MLTRRPELTPHAITAAANLGVYDEAYAKLRDEYLGVSRADSGTRLVTGMGHQALEPSARG
jgi:post-segregation antitoxin (ccd killing protein)